MRELNKYLLVFNMDQIKILLLLVFAFIPIEMLGCPSYLHNETLPKDTCIHEDTDKNIFYFKKCEGRKVCNTVGGEYYGKCTDEYKDVNKYPGEYCTKVDKCSYLSCTNNVCLGIEKDNACNSTFQCNPDLFCDIKEEGSGTCILKKENSTCRSDWECVITQVCNNEKCTDRASLKVGENATDAFACETLYIEDGKCAKGRKLNTRNSNGIDPLKCPDDGKCYYKSENESGVADERVGDCVCARGINHEMICPEGVGDFNISLYLNFSKNYNKNEKCNSHKGIFCKDKPINEIGDDFYKAYVTYVNIKDFSRTYNNTFYVKYLLNYDYWYSYMHMSYAEEKEISYNFLFITIGIVLVVDILLIFLYLRKWKSDAEIIDSMS